MQGTIERYIDRVMAVADIGGGPQEEQIREELSDHLEEKVASLESDGFSEAEALVKAVEDHGNPVVIGYRLRPWRLVDVRLKGTAQGVIAIGPKARGVVAIGGVAMGVVAFGGLALGAFSFGGLALGVLLAWGGFAGGAVAYGGFALGVVAFGGMAVGGIASGGAAAGLWVPGAGSALWSYFTWETVPDWLRGIGGLLSFNPESVEERQAFSTLMNTLTGITFGVLFVMLSIQGFLTSKETKRIRGIDPSVCE